MRNKRILALLLALMLLLVACSPGASQKPKDEPEKVTVDTSEKADETKPTETEEPITRLYETSTYSTGANGAISSGRKEATEIGIAVLKDGGNAVDAAVATAFGVMFFEVESTGIGGGGFMLVYDKETDDSIVIDMRETAPLATTREMFLTTEGVDKNGDGEISYREANYHPISSGVPGNLAGLDLALKDYGTMSLQDILEKYVIPVCEEGIYVTQKFYDSLFEVYDEVLRYEYSKKLWLDEYGLPNEVGTIIYNKDLVATYDLIAKNGIDIFYKGEIAEKIVEDVQKYGGILTMEDLSNYKPTIVKPVEGSYRDHKVVSSPPPSSGGTHLIQILNILENFDLKKMGHNSVDSLFLWSEIAKYVYSDRSEYMADTLFAEVPLKGLASKEYAKSIAEKIDLETGKDDIIAGNPKEYENNDTTHLSVIDKDGNMVAFTNTVNEYFGNGLTVEGTGIVMNNEMTDFDYDEPESINAPEPGKRPLSSMSPTLVFKPNGEPYLSIGTPGGFTIFYTLAQVISNVIDYDMTVEEAVLINRTMYDFAGAWYSEGNQLILEKGIDESVVESLNSKNQKAFYDPTDGYFGSVNGVYVDEDGFHAVADPRRDSHALAY